jgi:hypothetical protein
MSGGQDPILAPVTSLFDQATPQFSQIDQIYTFVYNDNTKDYLLKNIFKYAHAAASGQP